MTIKMILKCRSAKRRSLAVWRYLRDHPEVRVKAALPDSLYASIKTDRFDCPLCTLFRIARTCRFDCPLVTAVDHQGCTRAESAYERWITGDEEVRALAAGEIVWSIERWQIQKLIYIKPLHGATAWEWQCGRLYLMLRYPKYWWTSGLFHIGWEDA